MSVAGKSAGRSNLQLRVISGIILIIGALALTWAGGIWFRLLCVAIGAAVLYEWTGMTLPNGSQGVHRVLLSVLLGTVLVLLLVGAPASVLLPVLAGSVVLGVIHAVVCKAGFWPVAGLAYAALVSVSLALLRGADHAGLMVTLFLFAIVWCTDIFAYFVGRAVGGPKLAPSISPGKTWSGAVGGTIAAVVAGILVAHFAGMAWGLAMLALLVVGLSVISQIGDLFESRLKRLCSVKDSSQLIPGHGGVMDRVDGLATAALALYIVGAAFAGPDHPYAAFFAAPAF